MREFRVTRRDRAVVAALVVCVPPAGCAGVSSVLDRLAPAGGTAARELVAEVRGVDAGREAIDVHTPDGRRSAVAYDGRTRVIHRGRVHAVEMLEPGDLVAMRVRQSGGGDLYVDSLEVRRPARERSGEGIGSLRRLRGVVDEVDRRRGRFTLREDDGARVTVSIPYDAAPGAVRRFQRLQPGERISVEGHALPDRRLELTRFG